MTELQWVINCTFALCPQAVVKGLRTLWRPLHSEWEAVLKSVLLDRTDQYHPLLCLSFLLDIFRSAVDMGTEMLELDCHLTKDGHVVVSHDEELLRQTGHDVCISSLNLEVRGQG